ncbi:MAG: PLP-dependent aminotransferase family protein [Firmicutes bacterium]|nr:PLP-dependent aminotransferase family protein [Bacillota bacterium]
MLLFVLDESSRIPKFRQIMEHIRARVDNGDLRPGDRLPSTRRLAESLGVHRSTVAIAYQELWALGYLSLSPGRVPRVRSRALITTARAGSHAGSIDWEKAVSPAARTLLRTHRERTAPAPRDVIDFSRLDMDERLFPADAFRSCLSRVLRQKPGELLGYGDSAGYRPLREWIAHRLATHGIAATADEIVLTSGCQQALDLVLRMLARPGRAVAVESPTYDMAPPLLRFHGLRPVGVPVADDGMDLDRLGEVLQRESPVLVYTMPSFQNPTGISTGQAHRERLLSLCLDRRVPIFEDSFDEEMKYFGRAVLPLKSMDHRHTVIYSGTFSKVLFPGVRIGWVVAERRCVEYLVAIRRYSELSSNLVLQAAMEEFCRNGYYEAHVSRMHRVFRRRMRTALQALRRWMSPEWVTWPEPSGGYLIWLRLRLPPGRPVELGRALAEHGVRAAPGEDFFPAEPSGPCLRLSISGLDEQAITVGIQRLAAALESVRRRPAG